METLRLIENMIDDKLRTIKRTYAINGLVCIDRSKTYYKATRARVDALIGSLSCFNPAMLGGVNDLMENVSVAFNSEHVVINSDKLTIAININDGRFTKPEIVFHKALLRGVS